MAFDASSIDLQKDADSGAFCHLYNPVTREYLYDGDEVEGNEVGIYILGAQSGKARDALNRMARKQNGKKAKANDFDINKSEANAAEYFAEITTGWKNLAFEGEEEFAQDLVQRMYQSRPWIIQQLDEFVGDAANFTKRS